MNIPQQTLEKYIADWNLSDAQYIDVDSACSDVFAVKMNNGKKAALKIRHGRGIEAERFGATALDYFGGEGIVKLYNYDDRAHLLEFIDGVMLRTLVDNGQDDEATKIICDIIQTLHADKGKTLPKLNSLENHCSELFNQAGKMGASDVLVKAADIGRNLLDHQTEIKPLHGDVHHENILESTRGWVLIDPNGLMGDPVYEFANTFNNPINDRSITSRPERINMVADIIHSQTHYDRNKILQYAAMHMGLSASWHLSSGNKETAMGTLKNCEHVLKLVM